MKNVNAFAFPIRVTVNWYLKIIFGVGTIFSAGFAIAIWLSLHSFLLLSIPGLLALFGSYAFLLSFSTVQADEKSILITSPHGLYKIDWADIIAIEKTVTDDWRHESSDIVYAFLGENKCLTINLNFAGNGREEFFRFLEKQIIRLQIKVKPLSSKWLFPKNTRVRRFWFW